MSVPVFRSYTVIVGIMTAAMLAIVVIVNLVVDPYGVWRLVDREGFNAAKSERRDYAHLFKAADLRRSLPPILIIGSSRTAYGIDPDNADLVARGGAYNAAIPGGHLTVIRRYLELAVEAHPGEIQTVLFGVDFFEFNRRVFEKMPDTFDERRMRPGSMPASDMADVLLSLDALMASGRTVVSNVKRPDFQPYFQDGQLTAMEMSEAVRQRGMERRFRMSLDLYLNSSGRFAGYEWSDEAFAEFRRIVDYCRDNGIELIVFVPPVHAVLLEAIHYRGLWDTYEAWMRRIATVTPFWNFSGYNRFTTERLAYEMDHYWDISHYRSGVGDRMLGVMFNESGLTGSGDGFGRRVTGAEDVETVLGAMRSGREVWLSTDPRVVPLMRRVAD